MDSKSNFYSVISRVGETFDRAAVGCVVWKPNRKRPCMQTVREVCVGGNLMKSIAGQDYITR